MTLTNVYTDQHGNNISLYGLAENVTETNGHTFGNVTEKSVIMLPALIILVLACVVGTIGNCIILVAIRTYKPLKTVDSVFILNLALSDLYVTLVADPFSIVAKLHGADFFDSIPGLCQTIASMCTISCVSSLSTIALMSVNRYVYICKHEKYHVIFTYRNVIFMCISVYSIGTILVLLNLAGIGDHNFDHKSYECIWDRMATFPYTVVFSVTLVWIPTVVTGACYLRIYMFVKTHRRKIRQQNAENEFQKPIPNLRKLHLAKTLFIIYAVFATCWIPYALLIVVDSEDTFPHEVHVYITMFAHLHPSLNWIIYYITNKKFSQAYRQMFSRCCGAWCVFEPSNNDVTRGTRVGRDTSKGRTESCVNSHAKRDQIHIEEVTQSDLHSLEENENKEEKPDTEI